MVLCFVDKKGTETNIIDKLGNGFSRAPFATVVVNVDLIILFVCLFCLGRLRFI